MTTLDTSPHEIERILAEAAHAARPLADTEPGQRARYLRTIASTLEETADQLVSLALAETGLGEQRLHGELRRTTGQLRLFAEVLDEGSFLEAILDSADASAQPTPRPDLRRVLVALGPVEVFAASNFPFAFSVAGGDTAAALAAGSPVVLKAHPGHPELSILTGELVGQALDAAGAPPGTFAVVVGQEAGKTVLLDGRIKAAAFTGSTAAGRALHELASTRPEPIPFYGELGSLNPVFVTAAAVAERGEEIVRGFVDSFTLAVGQFCTKPGFLFLPVGHGLTGHLTDSLRGISAARMLSEDIATRYQSELDRISAHRAASPLLAGEPQHDRSAGPTLLQARAEDLAVYAEELLSECFGPASFCVEYADETDLLDAAAAFSGQLTVTVHAEPEDMERLRPLITLLEDRAGRIIWNSWPTGVTVGWAIHHGGPYPATTSSLHTSVGATSIRRFQRPVCYQSHPQELLPAALRDGNPLGIPRRIDGRLQPATRAKDSER